MTPPSLDPPTDEIRRALDATADWIVRFIGSIHDQPVAPRTSSDELRAVLDSSLPEEGTDLTDLLATFRDELVPRSRLDGHPRFFGYVSSPGSVVGAIGDLLASVLDANVTSWRSAPAATEVERLVVRWIAEIVGAGQGGGGLLTSGGSAANLAALAAARAWAAPTVGSAGVRPGDPRLLLYATTETHHSIVKAAALLGLGRDAVRIVRTDGHHRMDTQDLVDQVTRDRRSGTRPFCVVGTAGTVTTGSIDPLDELAAAAREHDLWFHVDAAYGGFAALAPSLRPKLAGIEHADTVTLDPHKWLYVPLDCGCLLYRDPSRARAAFSEDADYVRVVGREDDEAFAFWDYGPDLSRRFRALKVWLTLRAAGTRALGAAIERNAATARHFETLVREAPDFELLAPGELSIVCFRYRPDGVREGELEALNTTTLKRLQHGADVYLSNATVNGRFALRACILNHRTTDADVEVVLPAVRDAARDALSTNPP